VAISYSVNKAAGTFVVSYRATGPVLGIYTYTQRRGFLPFDLSAEGISPDSIESAQLILQCVTLVGGTSSIQLHSAIDPDGFGTTLQATNADWASSDTYLEDTESITSTGQYTWTIDPSHIDTTGVTYFRLRQEGEGGSAIFFKSATFNSTTAASNKPILRLVLASGQVIFVNQMETV
jgi:hypothetical protein